MLIAYPDHVEQTHVPVSQYRVGAYWFLLAIPKGVLVTEAPHAWWASYAGDWVQRDSFGCLEDAMEAAVKFARRKR